MKNQIKFIILYGISGALVWLFILPSYNGGGMNIFERDILIDKYNKNKEAGELKEKASQLAGTGKQLEQQYLEFKEDDKKKLFIAIPSSVDVVRALNEITALTESSKIELKGTAYSIQDVSSKNEILVPASFTVTVTATYDQLYSYIEKLQDNMRIFNIKTVSLKPAKEGNNIEVGILFSSFFFNSKANITDTSANNQDLATLESVINSFEFKEVDSILSLSKKLGNKMQLHPLISGLVDTTILIERQIVTQRTNPFIYKF